MPKHEPYKLADGEACTCSSTPTARAGRAAKAATVARKSCYRSACTNRGPKGTYPRRRPATSSKASSANCATASTRARPDAPSSKTTSTARKVRLSGLPASGWRSKARGGHRGTRAAWSVAWSCTCSRRSAASPSAAWPARSGWPCCKPLRNAAPSRRRTASRKALGGIFRYAIATHRADPDPVVPQEGALTPSRNKAFASITEPAKVGELLRAVRGDAGADVARLQVRVDRAPAISRCASNTDRAAGSIAGRTAMHWCGCCAAATSGRSNETRGRHMATGRTARSALASAEFRAGDHLRNESEIAAYAVSARAGRPRNSNLL